MTAVNILLSNERRVNAIQRLTALWAFTESGLGGVMHALQIPFTGLLVGGMAVIMISFIAEMSDRHYKQILKSAVIVLIVKAMVSLHTPFPAYIDVGFQAILGYMIFSLLRVNFVSIVLLSTIAMVESAIQKLLILTLFFGGSLWKAMDEMIALLTKQFGSIISNGSYWIVGIYILIYIAGGFFIAWLAYRTISNFSLKNAYPALQELAGTGSHINAGKKGSRNHYKKLWLLISIMVLLSVVLYAFADDRQKGWMDVARTISWTLSAILIWFMVIGPLFTKAIKGFLHQKQGRYSDEVLKTLSFIPVLRSLTERAWQQSKIQQQMNRWQFFFAALIYSTLIYQDTPETGIAAKKQS